MAFVMVVLSTLLWVSSDGRRIFSHEERGGEGICCCKMHKCRDGSDGTVYHFDQHMCCKQRPGKSCENTPHGYTEKQGPELCQVRPPTELPAWSLPRAQVNVQSLEPGSDAHTLKTHCARGSSGSEDAHEEDDLIGSLTHQLERNSLQSMTHDIFTMYACVRWAPEESYLPLVADEMDVKQVPSASKKAGDDPRLLMARAAENGNFVPLRCSENIGVYDVKVNGSHYPKFEERVQAMSNFFAQESSRFFDARATHVETRKMFNYETLPRWSTLLQHSSLFDMKFILERVKACSPKDSVVPSNASFTGKNGMKAEPEVLLESCTFIKWWAPKLKMYLARFPFQGFLANQKGSSLPAGGRVLICFGKRISGELHRRKGGSHILTDMNGVGCHGFWDFKTASQMLQRMVSLWAPPTCQLTELELKMKTRLLEMFTQMNKNLFEALPAIIASEQFDPSQPGADEARGLGKVTAAAQWVLKFFSSFSSTYKSLGELMGTSVMKWAVCPVGDEEGLDNKLGSDDMLTQRFTKQAYSFATGAKPEMPGAICEPFSFTSAIDSTESCEVGTVRSDYPEPYKGLEFACPAVPLWPGKPQLKLLSDSHKDKCFVWATPEQLSLAKWPYHGLSPLELQYPARTFEPSEQMELIQVLEFRSAFDVYGISRDYVSLGRVCTVEIRGQYERWCSKPEVWPASIVDQMAEAVSDKVDQAANFVQGTGVNLKNSTVWKSWAQRAALSTGSAAKRLASQAAAAASDAFSGLASARYKRIKQERMYSSFEAGEALWGAVFQASSQDPNAAGKRSQFQRYAISVPCPGVDVPSMIQSEFEWGQGALEVLRKSLTAQPLGSADTAVSLAVRSEYELHRGSQMRLRSFLAWSRVQDQWHQVDSTLSYLNSLLHISTGSSYSTSVKSLYGLSMRFVCGRRDQVYRIDAFTPTTTFRTCVMEGKKQAELQAGNQEKRQKQVTVMQEKLDKTTKELDAMRSAIDDASDGERQKLEAKFATQQSLAQAQEETLDALLRQQPPLSLAEFSAQIVVRVTFEPLQECQRYDQGLQPVIDEGGVKDAPEPAKHAGSIARALKAKSKSCKQAAALSQASNKDPSAVVGAWMGSGTPAETRKEVVIAAIDVAKWMP